MAVVELVVGRLSRSHRDRDTDLASLSPSSLFRSVTLLSSSFALPLPLPPSSILSLLSSRLPVLPPPDDSLLHEKNGRNFSTRSNVATDSGRGAGEPVALY